MNFKKILQDKKKELEKGLREVEVLLDKFAERIINKRDVMSNEEKVKWKCYLLGEDSKRVLEAKLSLINELLSGGKEKPKDL